MATATASSKAAAKGRHPQRTEPTSSHRASGEKRLFRYAPEPLLPRNTFFNDLLLVPFYSAAVVYFYSALDTVKSLIVQAIWSLIRKMSIARSRLAIGSLLDAIRIAGLVPHSQPGSP
jgi:hypothetical protein